MKRCLFSAILTAISVLTVWSQHADVVWSTPSLNSSESMPCGGGDVGMNVWVEDGDILFYLSRSGTFDENNTFLKLGRFRLRMTPNPFERITDFRQELKLKEGFVQISSGSTQVQIWADVFHPAVHVEIKSRQAVHAEVSYENWRYQDRLIRKGEGQQCSYKWAPPKGTKTIADVVYPFSIKQPAADNALLFYHRNAGETVFDFAVSQQGMEQVKEQMMNPLKNLTFGGCMFGKNFIFAGVSDGQYAGTEYKAWKLQSLKPAKSHHCSVVMHTAQTSSLEQWQDALQTSVERIAPSGNLSSRVIADDRCKTREWWKTFWQRSFIEACGEAQEITRNYTLFRYMLGCNAYGSSPTKFNGGLFTFDPCFVDEKQSFTPDYRKWGGGTMTAQNQRLVYWPMLKSGDSDMMPSQFDFYLKMLPNAELRSRIYWNHPGACFSEQIENFGLPNPAEYGFKRPDWFDKGLEYNAWLEYEWDTVLEFCQMILETKAYSQADISKYLPIIESALTFFDEHYQKLASLRGRKKLDENGHLILFPGSACETYKMTNNASSTVAALRKVLETYGKKEDMLKRIPEIPYRYVEWKDSSIHCETMQLKQVISPAKSWERVNNIETPQLYPVFPWRLFGIGKPALDVARNTYLYDSDAVKFNSHIGWKQYNIWAACLGLREEAKRLALAKLSDGPYRFPAFWGPGYDWTPDHNWGGSGMIGLQEMLLQTNGEEIFLFPAWPKEWDVHFKLHAPGQVVVEATLKNGAVADLKVTPESRKKDIVVLLDN